MNRTCLPSILLVGFTVLVVAAPASPHHSAAVAYDLQKYITLQGVVTEVKWENPHTWIYLDVKEANGAIVKWGFEGAVPNQLFRRGVTPAILKAGMPITIKGHPARDASRHFGEVHEIVLQDGKSFVIGASGTGPPSARPAGGRSGRGN
jgi:hypothetical protein